MAGLDIMSANGYIGRSTQLAVNDHLGLTRLIVGFKTGLRPLDFRFLPSIFCFGRFWEVEGRIEGVICETVVDQPVPKLSEASMHVYVLSKPTSASKQVREVACAFDCD